MESKSTDGLLNADWSEPLTHYIVESQIAKIPDDTLELAKRHILDTLAATIACLDLDAAVLSRRFVLNHSAGLNTAPILGTGKRCALLDAIFASAMCAHAAEINDFFPAGYVQPGGPVVSSALCLGETRGVTGEELLRSAIVGYEISCRMPMAIGLKNLQRTGLASHSVGPIWGCAAAVASMVRLPPSKMKHVFSYCTQQTSGSWQWLRDVDHIEKAFTFSGMPARRGTEAVLFVEAGFTGVGDPFKGDPGFLTREAFSKADFRSDRLVKDLGLKFILPLVGFKKYPSGGPTQPSVEAMLRMLPRIDRSRVCKVHIEMPGNFSVHVDAAMPALNLPYLMAILLLDGKLDFLAAQSRERMLNDAKVTEIIKKVTVSHDPDQEREPRVESARVTLTFNDATQEKEFVDHVKGFPAHPMDHNDVEEKAMGLIAPRLGASRARELINAVWSLEKIKEVKKIVELMAG
jgi:2-methylcitrate dehydratase PrpD